MQLPLSCYKSDERSTRTSYIITYKKRPLDNNDYDGINDGDGVEADGDADEVGRKRRKNRKETRTFLIY